MLPGVPFASLVQGIKHFKCLPYILHNMVMNIYYALIKLTTTVLNFYGAHLASVPLLLQSL